MSIKCQSYSHVRKVRIWYGQVDIAACVFKTKMCLKSIEISMNIDRT